MKRAEKECYVCGERWPDQGLIACPFCGSEEINLVIEEVNVPSDIRNIKWFEDDIGPYWTGELWKEGKRIGCIGDYYDREYMRREKDDTTREASGP